MLRVGSRLAARSAHSGPAHYDMVVVGGGLVGNAMAAAIGSSSRLAGKRVLLLEAGKTTTLGSAPSLHSNRVSAVSPISIALFEKLGIWPRLVSYRAQRVDELRVLDSCSQAGIHFDRPQQEEIAYIVENDAIVGALSDRLRECAGVTVLTGARVNKCSVPADTNQAAVVELEDGSKIETALLIGADGFRSRVREAMGVDYTSYAYEQSGVVATLRVDADVNHTAWQRFSRLGPIALLPLGKGLSSLVWSTSPEEAKRLCSIHQDEFVDELNEALFSEADQNPLVNQSLFLLGKLGQLLARPCPSNQLPPHVIDLQSDTRAAFPFGFGHAHSYIAARSAVIGDAAHRVHPLAGQGVNLGWNDVCLLTSALERATADGADIGCVTYLRDFDSAAQRHNVPVMVAIDWLNRLYRTDAVPLVMARSVGLAAVNALTPLKDLLIHQLSTTK